MKIAFIGQKGIPAIIGGVERHVEEVAIRLAKAGHDVTVYTRPNYTDKNIAEYKGVKLVSFSSVPTKHLDAISHTFASIFDVSRKDFDIVHFHSIGPSLLIPLMKVLKPNLPIISTFHSKDYFHKKWSWFARLSLHFGEWVLCRFSDQIITVSKALTRHVEKKHNQKAKYIPNGITMPQNKSANLIKKWGIEEGEYILAVTRLIRHKGIHYLIDAYNKTNTNKKLVIVGEGFYSDDYVNELYGKAEGNPNIIFTGIQTGDVLNELFSNAYLFAQPSESEGLSIALLEGMSYGLPVLVSDILENKEVIENIGFKFTSSDVGDLTKKLDEVLKMDNIKECGRLARNRVERHYNWNMISEDLEDLYRVVINRKDENKIGTKRLFRKIKKA